MDLVLKHIRAFVVNSSTIDIVVEYGKIYYVIL